ncbi:MAG: glucosamine-6-phosphate deaminase [Phycisphaeraceae bacterium]|nr:glucosamine-6-phosphate deaminase [Phycisphaeraceae bacterium]
MKDPVRSFGAGTAQVHVFADKRDMGAAAARDATAIIGRAIEQRGVARLIVGTGNSQDEVIDELTRQPVDWKSVVLFHMDEYVGMPMTHPASFRLWLKTRLADVVGPRDAHYLAGDAADQAAECRRYADLLGEAPIDLCFIGFGENGHIAFNDPHVADFNDLETVKIVEMDEKCRAQQVGEGHFPDLASMPKEAITLTCPALFSARNLIACVPDRRKAEAAKNAIEGPLDTRCPASMVMTHANATVYLDRESASLLQ